MLWLVVLAVFSLVVLAVGWWVVIWVCMVSAVLIMVSYYESVGVSDCSFGGMFCCDEVSCGLMWLSVFVVSLSLLASLSILSGKDEDLVFLLIIVGLVVVLVICFAVDSLFVFYIFFEVSGALIFFAICGWGYWPERLQAGKYILLYMVVGSLPLLVYIFYLFFISGSGSFVFFCVSSNEVVQSSFVMFLAMSVAFLIKSPVYGVHLWLPKAHVEASVGGSMVLAGVLLKLGGYGLIRFSSFLVFSNTVVFSCIICLCIFGGVVASVVCCVQVDSKCLIAYSSIGHMSLVVSGLMCGSWAGLGGSVVLMLGHGLSSCGMFFLVGDMYKLYSSRMLFVMRGGVGSLLGINFWLVLMCGLNAGVPLSLNFCGEVILYISLISNSWLFGGFVGALSFFSCLYSWMLYCSTQVGGCPLWVYPSCLASDLYVGSVVCCSIFFYLVGLCFALF